MQITSYSDLRPMSQRDYIRIPVEVIFNNFFRSKVQFISFSRTALWILTSFKTNSEFWQIRFLERRSNLILSSVILATLTKYFTDLIVDHFIKSELYKIYLSSNNIIFRK